LAERWWPAGSAVSSTEWGRFSGFKRPRTDVGVTHADAIHYFDAAGRRRGRIGQQIGPMEYDALKDHAPGREVGRERAGEETPELIRRG
jgi:hypothetical protein